MPRLSVAVEKIRILVVDDHAIFRQGLVALLRLCPDMEVVGEGRSGEEAVALASELSPDLIVMDHSMPPGMGGIEATRAIRAADPEAKVIILSMNDAHTIRAMAVEAGVRSYLCKTVDAQNLCDTVRAVARS